MVLWYCYIYLTVCVTRSFCCRGHGLGGVTLETLDAAPRSFSLTHGQVYLTAVSPKSTRA